jgi:hypothetical protein
MATKTTPPIKRLLAAIESGDIQLVERLIVKGAKVNGEHWHETPSSCAIRKNQTQILALLICHGLDLRGGEDGTFLQAAYYKQQDSMRLLCTTVFGPDLWRGKSRAEIEKEAALIYRNIEANIQMALPGSTEALRFARLELFDAAMTCWEHVRPDPPKITISDVPAKAKAL